MFLLLFVSSINANCKELNSNNCAIIGELLDKESSKFKVYYRRQYIHKKIRKQIEELADIKFNLANPNEKYQGTDNKTKLFLQTRRLIFVACSNNLWIISYEHGGRGHHLHSIVIKANDKNEIEEICSLDVNGNYTSLNSLFLLLKANKFKPCSLNNHKCEL